MPGSHMNYLPATVIFSINNAEFVHRSVIFDLVMLFLSPDCVDFILLKSNQTLNQNLYRNLTFNRQRPKSFVRLMPILKLNQRRHSHRMRTCRCKGLYWYDKQNLNARKVTERLKFQDFNICSNILHADADAGVQQ